MDDKAQVKKPIPKQFAKPQVNANTEKYGPDFRHIVRIVNNDLKGEKKVLMGLQKIKGVGYMFSHFVCQAANIEYTKIVGKLTDSEIQKIEDIIRNPAKYDCPSWMMNRRKDYETGQDMHIITTDWDLSIDNDIKRMKKIKSYKGVRHMIGQPVRGQRTKSNFRKNKGKVSLGVVRKGPAPGSDKKDKKK